MLIVSASATDANHAQILCVSRIGKENMRKTMYYLHFKKIVPKRCVRFASVSLLKAHQRTPGMLVHLTRVHQYNKQSQHLHLCVKSVPLLTIGIGKWFPQSLLSTSFIVSCSVKKFWTRFCVIFFVKRDLYCDY